MKGIAELAAGIERHARSDGLHRTAIGALDLFRRSETSAWAPALYEPALFFLARGSKEVQVGELVHRHDSAQYVMASVDLPLTCRVSEASAAEPYLGMRLRIDPVVVGEMLADGAGAPGEAACARGWVATPIEPELLDATVRLVSLLDKPAELPVLAPLVQREITYRVLTGPQGGRLRQAVASGAPAERISRAISWIKEHAAEPVSVERLAERVEMRHSAFHLHFKTVTGMSPIQFQKRLRLMESRRLMLTAGMTAAEAAGRVGYASPSQFSRDYRRLFGAPPRQDVAALRPHEGPLPA